MTCHQPVGQADVWSGISQPRVVLLQVNMTYHQPVGQADVWSGISQPRVVLLQVNMTCHQPVGQADVWSDVPPPPSPLCLLNAPTHHPHLQYRHLKAKSSTTSGHLDIWSAFGSGWPVYVRVHLVPAATVIPAPWVDIKIVAVKKLICYCLQFSMDCLWFWQVCPVCNIPSLVFKSTSSFVWISAHTCNISQNIHSQAPVCFTTHWTKWSGHGKMIDPPGELLHMKDLLPRMVTI